MSRSMSSGNLYESLLGIETEKLLTQSSINAVAIYTNPY